MDLDRTGLRISERAAMKCGPVGTGRYLIAILVASSFLFEERPVGAFRAQMAEIPGEIQELGTEDLDGDGRREIFVAVNEIRGMAVERYLQVFAGPENPEAAGLVRMATWKVHPEAVFWDFGPAVKGSADRRSLYFLAHGGLWSLPRGGAGIGDPICEVPESLLVATAQEDGFPSLDFIRDWDGDGNEEAMLPLGRTAQFHRWASPGSWQLSDVAEVSPFSVYNNNIVFGLKVGSYQYLTVLFYPLVEPADLNRDGRKDLLVLRDGKGLPFFRGAEGKLDQQGEPWDLDIRSAEEKRRHTASLSYRVADLNRDGCADVVVHKVGVKFADWDSETVVFLGRPDGLPGREPDLRFPSRGLLSGVSVEDLDGDGFPDMNLWSVRMGLWPIIEILLRRVVHLESSYYYGLWPPGFAEEPEARRGFEFRIDTERPDLFSGLVPSTEGDFDGDGLKDMVAKSGDDELGIYLGMTRRGFSSSPWESVKDKGVAHVNYVRAEDLDGDGLCDILAYEVHKGSSVLHAWTRR